MEIRNWPLVSPRILYAVCGKNSLASVFAAAFFPEAVDIATADWLAQAHLGQAEVGHQARPHTLVRPNASAAIPAAPCPTSSACSRTTSPWIAR